MPDNNAWHDDPALRRLGMKGMTWVYARVIAEPVQDPERRCHQLQVRWDLQFRTTIDVGWLGELRAKALADVADMVAVCQQVGKPMTPQEIAQMEAEFQVPTLVPEATYGHERQHRVAIQQAVDAAAQPGGPLHELLERAGRLCTSRLIAQRYARVWRRWFLYRLSVVAQSGAGHDNDPATPKPPAGVGVPLPPGEALPPPTTESGWSADAAALDAGGYELIAPRFR